MAGIPIVRGVQRGERAINFINTAQPDVFLMYITMSGITGIEVARWIADINTPISVILMSGNANRHSISARIKAGIAGYVLKTSTKASSSPPSADYGGAWNTDFPTD